MAFVNNERSKPKKKLIEVSKCNKNLCEKHEETEKRDVKYRKLNRGDALVSSGSKKPCNFGRFNKFEFLKRKTRRKNEVIRPRTNESERFVESIKKLKVTVEQKVRFYSRCLSLGLESFLLFFYAFYRVSCLFLLFG